MVKKNLMNDIGRLWNKLYAKYITPLIEKTYQYRNINIHYLLYQKTGKTLLIIFQSYSPGPPRYHYLYTLSKYNPRLYIKDDFAECGSYYLDKDFVIEEGVYDLIQKTAKECQAEKLIFIGSSKGGYAAVNFGMMFPNSIIIAGAPQYYLGDYMFETKKFNPALKTIIDDFSEENINKLNGRLPAKIRKANGQTAYIHCSANETTYDKHVKHMIEDMKNAGICVNTDLDDYTEHNDVRIYFPIYLDKVLKEVKGEQER